MDFVKYTYVFLFWLVIASFNFVGYNFFVALVYLEFAALAIGIILVLRSLELDDRYYEMFAISLIAVAGAESAIAVSLLISIDRLAKGLTAEQFARLKV